ncbi:hydrogenase maturation nickel metallochaperone HypA [Georgenia sp. SYP-B2076]|uniref:hydrogenase maturation nickel metallochaperone HypA/HybF n=1 Tax=Georgenia sp. SYP-B2076 TaxID=2495881 RepID=UPI000F8F2914|nr:hydrogenase maturation nickel metallochaperone HypA [Georgenia sp. SYP-B2076]
MHELSLTQSVVDAVLDRTGGRKVTAVNLTIGRLSGVVPEAVRFCFDVVAEGTTLAGAQLNIEEPAGAATCRSCGRDFEISDPILLCPCGSADVAIRSGRELAVTSVRVV